MCDLETWDENILYTHIYTASQWDCYANSANVAWVMVRSFFSSREEASVFAEAKKTTPSVCSHRHRGDDTPACILRPDKLNLRKRKQKRKDVSKMRGRKRSRNQPWHRVRGSHKRLIARRAASILARGNRWKKATVIYGNWDPIPINGDRPSECKWAER